MQILVEILDKKISILNQLLEECINQRDIVKAENIDWDAFDHTVDSKADLIDELNRLDDGFEATFARKKDILLSNKTQYHSEIAQMQDKIRLITDMSAQLQKQEYQNKEMIEKAFKETRQQIGEGRRSSKAAMDYYQKMNKINLVDPQLMDRKS